MASPCRVCSRWLLVLDWVGEHLFLIQSGGILMPVRSRSADDPPRRTPSLVCEVPLRVSRTQEQTLLARLEAARQVYNACLGQARRRVRLVRESTAFQRALTLPRDEPTRKALFAQARSQHAFSEYALHAYAQQFGQCWLGEHLDSLTLQKLASRAYAAANRLLLGRAKRVRFKGKHQLDSVEGKTNTSGIRWCGDRVEWKGLVLQALLDPRDQVQVHGLAAPVKYVRLVRRKLGEHNRFSAQLVCQGVPWQKPSTSWEAESSGWTWARARSRWSRSNRRCSSRSAPRWRPMPKPCDGWSGSSTGSAAPITR